MNVAPNHDPLLRGFYTVTEAARLLRIENKRRIYRWIETGKTEAVIARDYVPVAGTQELSFWDLIEVRFIEHFRSQGLSLQFLRKVAVKAREQLGTSHPFALSKTKFLTDRRRIFLQTAKEEAEEQKRTQDVLSGQYEMYEAIEELLAKGIAFHPVTELADEWQPLENDCPNVIINPRYAFGQPVVRESKVPTAAIFRTFKAEGNRDRVAKAYGVKRKSVDEAIDFELRLAT